MYIVSFWNIFVQGGPHLDGTLWKRPPSCLSSFQARVVLFSWPPQVISLCCQKSVNGTQFSHPCSYSLQFISDFGDCPKQAQGGGESKWPYPGHRALWSKGSFMSAKLWITVLYGSLAAAATLEWAEDSCKHNLELPRGQSGGPLSARPTRVGQRSRHKAIFAQLCAKHSSAGAWGQSNCLKKHPLFFPFLFQLLFFLSHLLFCP